jgi:hypothetical protein
MNIHKNGGIAFLFEVVENNLVLLLMSIKLRFRLGMFGLFEYLKLKLINLLFNCRNAIL